MALSGTLSDLGIVDLIQFPGTGKKTGELIIAGVDDEARLFYDHGSLKHVTCGEDAGMEALVKLVSWEEGEFEFRMGASNETISIEIDLHRALMIALKTRDEKREEARKLAEEEAQKKAEEEANASKSETPPQNSDNADDPHMQQLLSRVASSFPYIEYAAVSHSAGAQVCLWSRNNVDVKMYTQIITSISDVFNSHPRKALQKVYLTDNAGTCIGYSVKTDLLLFLAASDDSSLGVVSIAASKIANALTGDSE